MELLADPRGEFVEINELIVVCMVGQQNSGAIFVGHGLVEVVLRWFVGSSHC